MKAWHTPRMGLLMHTALLVGFAGLSAVALASTENPLAPPPGGLQRHQQRIETPKEQTPNGSTGKPEPQTEEGLPKPVELSTKDVERLLQILPQVARLGAEHNARMQREGEAPDAQNSSPEQAKLKQVLSANGLTMSEFASQTATLVTTYLALSPQALDEQLPHESSPEVQRVLRDPSVSPEEKEQVRQQVKAAQENKAQIRAQLNQMVTEHNKQVVTPLLPRVKAALDQARSEASKSMSASPEQHGD
jgi:hypothetical protein